MPPEGGNDFFLEAFQEQKNRPLQMDFAEDGEISRGTTSIYRLRGLMGYEHIPDAVSGVSRRCLLMVRQAAQEGIHGPCFSCLAPPGRSLKGANWHATWFRHRVSGIHNGNTLSLLSAAVNG